MLKKRKTATANLKYFGGKRKNKYSGSWKTELLNFGVGRQKKTRWWETYVSIINSLIKTGKRKSYLSRSEKRKKVGLKTIRAITVMLGLVLAVAIARKPMLLLLVSLDFFRITEIEIVGCSMTKAADIRAVAGYEYNASLFSQAPAEVSRRIEKYPWVQKAEVSRIWPDEIRIEISENKAAAIMLVGEQGQEKMVYLDRYGVEIAPVRTGDDVDYPVITGVNILTGREKDEAMEDAVVFMKLIGRNNPNLPAQSVSEIHFDISEGMVVRLVDFPFPIYFGRGNVTKKYKQLRNVMAVIYKKRKAKVDIGDIKYIRMDYSNDKVLVAKSNSG